MGVGVHVNAVARPAFDCLMDPWSSAVLSLPIVHLLLTWPISVTLEILKSPKVTHQFFVFWRFFFIAFIIENTLKRKLSCRLF